MSKQIAVGERVRIIALPAYLKTAEPMPMLRPSDLLKIGDEGVAIAQHPGGYWSIRFARGAFLMETQYLEVVS